MLKPNFKEADGLGISYFIATVPSIYVFILQPSHLPMIHYLAEFETHIKLQEISLIS